MKSPQKEPSHPGWGWGCNERTSSAGRLCAPRTSTGFLPVTSAHTPQAALTKLHSIKPHSIKPHRPPTLSRSVDATMAGDRWHHGPSPFLAGSPRALLSSFLWAASRALRATSHSKRGELSLVRARPVRSRSRPCDWLAHSIALQCRTTSGDWPGRLARTASLDNFLGCSPWPGRSRRDCAQLALEGGRIPGPRRGAGRDLAAGVLSREPPAHSPLTDWKCKPRAKSRVPLKMGVPCRDCR